LDVPRKNSVASVEDNQSVSKYLDGIDAAAADDIDDVTLFGMGMSMVVEDSPANLMVA